ncbi:hypothetical protein Scep_030122 [Stephania cephalantha]|uniref:Uncharacterized protein n=1 Tax=Stephania cephalantha TaxID=152367 RepID=A0AAP0DZ36_9MAGN
MATWACLGALVRDSADSASAARDQVLGQLDVTTSGNLVTQKAAAWERPCGKKGTQNSGSGGSGVDQLVRRQTPVDQQLAVEDNVAASTGGATGKLDGQGWRRADDVELRWNGRAATTPVTKGAQGQRLWAARASGRTCNLGHLTRG